MAAVTFIPEVFDRRTRTDSDLRAGLGLGLNGRMGQRLQAFGFRRGPAAIPVPGIRRNIQVKVASTRAEWEEAFRLVAENYQARGYDILGDKDLRFTPFHALPDTVTYVAKERDRVLAAFSLVPDNVLLGLPMERVYEDEVRRLRREGRHLVETTCLADRDLHWREFTPVFLTLIRLAWQQMVRQGGDTAVITINPRHRIFYTRVLGFVPIGLPRAYPSVCGHPAEAYYLDREIMKARAPQVHQLFFGRPLPTDALAPFRMPTHLVRAFAARSRHVNPAFVEEILRYVERFGSPRRW